MYQKPQKQEASPHEFELPFDGKLDLSNRYLMPQC